MSQDSLKYNTTQPDLEVIIRSRIQKELAPNTFLSTDTINNTSSVLASAIYNATQYVKSNIASQVSPFLATGRNLEFIGLKYGVTSRFPSSQSFCTLSIKRDPNFPAQILAQGTKIDIEGSIFITEEDLALDQSIIKATSEEFGSLEIVPTYGTFENKLQSFEEVVTVEFFTDGKNSENDDEFRSRIINAMKNPLFYPNESGIQEEIKKNIPSVRGIKTEVNSGQIYIYPICQQDLFPPYGIPNKATLEQIQKFVDTIDTYGIRNIQVVTPETEVTDMILYSIRPDTVTVREQIIKLIEQYFNTISVPGTPYNGTDLRNIISSVVGLASYNEMLPNSVIYPSDKKFFILGKIEFLEGKNV